jgi:tRNA pseudouridine38-40 synthase
MRLAAKFAYDGRKFHGYARQPNLKTVEKEIINTLIKHDFIEDAVESNFRSASRTDKGVSALGNVVAFNTTTSKKDILNLSSDDFTDILLYGIKEVEPDFNPRHAIYRHYSYYLNVKNIDVEKLMSASAIFAGEHDFSNFARVEASKNPVRTIDNIVFTNEEDFLVIDFYAQTFLWNQIRRIISALEKIGRGDLAEEQVAVALFNPCNKVDLGLAPAKPLILKDISYRFEFEYDEKLIRKLADFEKKIVTFCKSV